MLRQLEMKVEVADRDHRNVVKPALQLMICLIAKVKASSCSDTSGEQTDHQTHADGTEATIALLKTWNSKLPIRQSTDGFIKVSRKLVNWYTIFYSLDNYRCNLKKQFFQTQSETDVANLL